jgi:glycosyltransferase involved in cell wall biosynthesis
MDFKLMKLEIYAANLRQGGATVTAAALLDGMIELIRDERLPWIDHMDFVVSPQVINNMANTSSSPVSPRLSVTVREDTPSSSVLRPSKSGVDLRYVVFGPDYRRSQAKVTVLGFADGTLIPSWQMTQMSRADPRELNFRGLIKTRIKTRIMNNYDAFVVQTTAMAQAISAEVGARPIAVIPNMLSAPFSKIEMRTRHDLPQREENEIRLFYPARAYPHKNHGILSDVSRQYKSNFDSRLTFVVTLTNKEYAEVFPTECPEVMNIGPVAASTLPSLYAQTDGLFFPSLNETFSASPLEAAFMRKPIVISDRPFARDLLSDRATYFDPADAADAACKIHEVIKQVNANSNDLEMQLSRAEQWAEAHLDPKVISLAHLDFLHACSTISS